MAKNKLICGDTSHQALYKTFQELILLSILLQMKSEVEGSPLYTVLQKNTSIGLIQQVMNIINHKSPLGELPTLEILFG